MIDIDNFIIHAQKDLIFRREPLFDEDKEWITFDPVDLEYYALNTTAAEIFYIISVSYTHLTLPTTPYV